MSTMPRFSDRPHIPPPAMPDEPLIEVLHGGKQLGALKRPDLEALGLSEHQADFHCVTTWSVTRLIWTGVPLRQILASIGISNPPEQFLLVRGADRRRATFLWQDAVADDVLIATELNGQALGDRHGGPLRLVAPSQYGYKSVKHLSSIEFCSASPGTNSKEHLRARVGLEERHPTLPNWLVKVPYRLLIAPTAYIAERNLR